MNRTFPSPSGMGNTSPSSASSSHSSVDAGYGSKTRNSPACPDPAQSKHRTSQPVLNNREFIFPFDYGNEATATGLGRNLFERSLPRIHSFPFIAVEPVPE